MLTFLPRYTTMQEEKREVREKVITHAVRSLTTEGRTSTCVQRNYPRDVWNESHAAVTNNWSQERIRRMNEQLQEWESYYDSTTTPTKKPSDLRVCCLGGDDPTNDLAVFKREGVLCTNIWVLEKKTAKYFYKQKQISKSQVFYIVVSS